MVWQTKKLVQFVIFDVFICTNLHDAAACPGQRMACGSDESYSSSPLSSFDAMSENFIEERISQIDKSLRELEEEKNKLLSELSSRRKSNLFRRPPRNPSCQEVINLVSPAIKCPVPKESLDIEHSIIIPGFDLTSESYGANIKEQNCNVPSKNPTSTLTDVNKQYINEAFSCSVIKTTPKPKKRKREVTVLEKPPADDLIGTNNKPDIPDDLSVKGHCSEMPDYTNMSEYMLGKQMQNYGLKKLPSAKAMASKLTDIWRILNSSGGNGATTVVPPATVVQVPLDKGIAKPKLVKRPRKTKLTEEENNSELDMKIRDAIKADVKLHEMLLSFQAVSFSRILNAVAASGVKCTDKYLLRLLDTDGVTFVNGRVRSVNQGN